jgi:hypothetical protein
MTTPEAHRPTSDNRAVMRWVLARASLERQCGHFTTTPVPMFVFAWDPLLQYRCEACAAANLARLSGTEQNLDCDRCHQVEGGGTANMMSIEAGPSTLTVAWALCNACEAEIVRQANRDRPVRADGVNDGV